MQYIAWFNLVCQSILVLLISWLWYIILCISGWIWFAQILLRSFEFTFLREPVVLFSCNTFVRSNVTGLKISWEEFWKTLWRVNVNSPSNILWHSSINPFNSFLFGKILMTNSVCVFWCWWGWLREGRMWSKREAEMVKENGKKWLR